MKLLRFIILLLFLFNYSCDDGDIITVELEFDRELELCGDTESDNYVIYDTKIDPNESLTLLFDSNTTNDLIFNPDEIPYTNSFIINGSTTRFNYRVYDGNPAELICAEIPSSTVNITEDYEAMSGTVNFTSTYIDDDGDGIPSEDENQDPNGDGDFEDAQDWDGDGIPDYLDEDDDNDNIKTINEDSNEDGDGNPFTNPRNTDGEDDPDYLDADDDNDGIITRYEDENGNMNPIDDFADGASVARFLDATAVDEFPLDEFIANAFMRTVTVMFVINDVDIQILSSDEITLGTYTTSFDPNAED